MTATEEKATQILREMVKKFLDTAEDWRTRPAISGQTRAGLKQFHREIKAAEWGFSLLFGLDTSTSVKFGVDWKIYAEWGDWLHRATDGNTRRNEYPTRTPLI